MSTVERYRELRSGYYRRVELGALIAVGLHALVFTLAPPYVPRPFRLPPDRPLRLMEEPGGARMAAVGETPRAQGRVTVPAPELAAVESEQLETVPASRVRPAAPAGGVGEAGGGAGSGAGGEGAGLSDEPPVFYSYETAPQVVRRVEPDYPLRARVAGEEGTVVINVNVDASGRILRAWVAQSTAPEALVEAALDAVYQFQFLPGKQGGFPVKCTVAIPIHFSLKKMY